MPPDLETTIQALWQDGQIVLLPGSGVDPVELIRRVFGVEPPAAAAEFYRLVSGGTVAGMPLFGVNFIEPGCNLIAEHAVLEPIISAGYWPIASDGCGNLFVCFEFGGCHPIGFVESIRDPVVPERIVASSIETLLVQLGASGVAEDDRPATIPIEVRDPDTVQLDETYQRVARRARSS